MKNTFDFISDPGHGWLKVSLSDIAALGLTNRDFSAYSYRRDNDLYLEEDCDASKFIIAYKRHTGKEPKFRERVARERRSKIRGYLSNYRD